MPSPSSQPEPPRESEPIGVRRVAPEHAAAAAERLLGRRDAHSMTAARQFVQAAPSHGIDLSLLWTTRANPIGQVALVTPGAGRTAMLFLGEPRSDDGPSDAVARELERLIDAVGEAIREDARHEVAVLQCLPLPTHDWAHSALRSSGYTHVGDLAYLSASLGSQAPPRPDPPGGVRVRLASELTGDDDLLRALDRSYEHTLDCPELCGLRSTRDILDSHRAAGEHDPTLWRLAYIDDRPEGICLVNPNADTGDAELVYLGLSTELRGRGVGAWLLARGMDETCRRGIDRMICAVDLRNTPALALYRRFGFTETSQRSAFVRTLD
ncbi:MAG: GNAT family N-acetyltransferase [Planctomycetota bacterium]